MTGLFDGMAGALSQTFGASVLYTPASGTSRTVVSVFRRMPVRAMGPDGTEVLLSSPSWRVRSNLVPELRRGDRVDAAGSGWRVLNVWPQGSPAADAHLICELDGPIPAGMP